MTVAQLIKKLERYPSQMEVMTPDNEGEFDLTPLKTLTSRSVILSENNCEKTEPWAEVPCLILGQEQ